MIILVILLAAAFTFYVVYSDNRYGRIALENKKLKEKINEMKTNTTSSNVTADMLKNPSYNQISQQNVPLRQSMQQVNTQVNQAVANRKVNVVSEEEKRKIREERERKERETNNIIVLVAGAVLIVLSAIVFLLSTWQTIPDIIKTITILFVGGVFLGASKLAKEQFNLPKASKAFFYIGMIYLPICLMSIWIFGLLGDYLSVFGDGSSIYLTISSLIIAGVYYAIYKTKGTRGMLYGSIVFQILATIFFVLIFTDNICGVLCGILTYNLLLLAYNKLIEKEPIEVIKYINYIVGMLASVLSVLTIIFRIQETPAYIIANILSVATFILFYIEYEKNILNSIFTNFFISLTCYSLLITVCNGLDDLYRVIIAVSYILIANIIQRFIKNEDFSKVSNVISIITLALTYIFGAIQVGGLIAGIVALIQFALCISIYIQTKEVGKWLTAILIPLFLIIGLISIFAHFVLDYYVYVITFLALTIIAEVLKNYKKDLHVCSLVITHIATGALFIIESVSNPEFLKMPLYFFALAVIYAVVYIRNKKWNVFKYLAYLLGTASIATLLNMLDLGIDVIKYTPMLATTIIAIVEAKLEFIKDKISTAFIIFMELASYACLLVNIDEITIVLGILFALAIYYFNIYTKKNLILNIIPLLCVFRIVVSNSIDEEFITMIKLIIVCALTGYTIYQKKISVESVFSAIFLASTFGMVDGYVRYFIIMIWAAINMAFMENKTHKDVFKIALYISGFMLYKEAITNLGILDQYKSFLFMGIVVLYDLIMKNVINKYSKETEFLDYFFYIVFNLAIVSRFLNPTDGLIYVVFLIGSIMFSYALGWGSIFFVSIGALGINLVYLTREFWLNVPWYIYLLATGGILIGFAIVNEINEKKNKVNIGKSIVNLKHSIDQNNIIESTNLNNNDKK